MNSLHESAVDCISKGKTHKRYGFGTKVSDAPKDKGIRSCIPGRKSRSKPVKYDRRRYKRRNRVEIMFGLLKDLRRVATRYARCPMVFLSVVALAETV